MWSAKINFACFRAYRTVPCSIIESFWGSKLAYMHDESFNQFGTVGYSRYTARETGAVVSLAWFTCLAQASHSQVEGRPALRLRSSNDGALNLEIPE